MKRWIAVIPAVVATFGACTDVRNPIAPQAPLADVSAASSSSESVALQIEAISDALEALVSSGVLSRGPATALQSTIGAAKSLLEAGKIKQGHAMLASLVAQLRALVSARVLSAEQAAPLLAAAENATAGGLSLVSVTSGEVHACGLTMDGQAWCWGYNRFGQLGDGTETSRSVPAPVNTDLRFTSLSAGGFQTCGLTGDGAAYCWGRGDLGQLGNGARENSALPVRVSGDATWAALDVAWSLSCALTTDGMAFCWGSNQYAALGTSVAGETCPWGASSMPCSTTPTAVSGGNAFRSLAVGLLSSCGLDAAGTARCWGWDTFGELGDGATTGCVTDPGFRCAATPVTVLGGPFTSISAGGAFACGVTSEDAAFCWGFNAFGQMGNGTKSSSDVPVPLSGDHLFSVVKATKANSILGHACGLTAAGEAFCWGSNAYGQLGATPGDACPFPNVSPSCSLVPVAVDGGIPFSTISPGNGFTCGVDVGRGVWCWGRNESGEVGDGTNSSRTTPTRVLAP